MACSAVGKEHRFHLFDFGGAGRPDEDYGPRKLKAKFNGALVNYGRNVFVHYQRLLRLARRAYHVYRRLQ